MEHKKSPRLRTSATALHHTSTTPLITIVTHVRNGAGHSTGTINSIAAQTLRDFEYVAIDRQSTDGTLDIFAGHWYTRHHCGERDG